MLDKTNLFNSHNSFVNNIFCIFAAIFCISYVEIKKNGSIWFIPFSFFFDTTNTIGK